MSELVKLSVTLGALGLKKIATNEASQEILKFGLCFILPEDMVVRKMCSYS